MPAMDLGMSDRVKPLVEQVRDIVRNEVIPLEGDYLSLIHI